MPSANPTVIKPASITRRVGLEQPATIASAWPSRTIMPPKYMGFDTSRVAIDRVIDPRTFESDRTVTLQSRLVVRVDGLDPGERDILLACKSGDLSAETPSKTGRAIFSLARRAAAATMRPSSPSGKTILRLRCRAISKSLLSKSMLLTV